MMPMPEWPKPNLKDSVPAELRWVVFRSFEQFRSVEGRFAVPARFDHQGEDWKNNAWSLVIQSEAPARSDGTQPVRVWFLVPDAPHEWLVPGRGFVLYEGSVQIAEGTVTSSRHPG
jgi:hypothetical protein